MHRARPSTRSPGRPLRRINTGPRSRTSSRRNGNSADTHAGLYEVDYLMGTCVSLHLSDNLSRDDLVSLSHEVFAWLRLVEDRFSMYQPASEISHIRRGELQPGDYSPEVRSVLNRCHQLSLATNGYFDPYATGALDPSGFVKGWAVQTASDRLLKYGCVNHCINAGADIRARGHVQPDHPWRVNLRHPSEPASFSCVVTGTDLAIATSSVYERGWHVIDPHQGRPTTDLRSVTVIGQDLGVANAYATAAVAMGMPALTWLASLKDHEAAVITDDGRYFRSDGLTTP